MNGEVISKPNREPDFMSRGTSYFWFQERIYRDVDSKLLPIEVDQEYGLIRLRKEDTKACRHCDRCKANKHCVRSFFSEQIQRAYSYWNHGEFEKILGLTDE